MPLLEPEIKNSGLIERITFAAN